MFIPKEVEIIEVGPRDGLQNEPLLIPTKRKKELITALAHAGFSRIETTAFVHPEWVPQMSDTEEIAHFCNELGIQYIALTPNLKALDRAITMNVPQIAVFVGASTEFNKRNINRSTKESLAECKPLIEKAKEKGMFVRAYVSMAFSCPFQGAVSLEEVTDVCEQFIRSGADEIDIGDTNGQANPKIVYERFSRLKELYPQTTFVAHFHDTKKMALANVIAAMQAGVTKFDSSIGGLGGCPYSPGATGNVATEDLLHMVLQMGCETTINYEEVLKASALAKKLTTR